MEIFSNPITDVLLPIRGILSILIALFPPNTLTGVTVYSTPFIVSMVVLGILLIVLGRRITGPLYFIIYGFVAYWWVLHERVQLTGQADYVLASLAFFGWMVVALLSDSLRLSFMLAYLLPILVVATLFLSTLFLPCIVILVLLFTPLRLVVRLMIVAAVVVIFVAFQNNSIFVILMFPLAAVLGAELGLQSSLKRWVDPLLEAILSVIGGITGLVLIAQVSRETIRSTNTYTTDMNPIILVASGIMLIIALVFIYRNFKNSLTQYQETDDSISIVRRYPWMRYVVLGTSLFIGLYSLLTLYGEVIEDTEQSDSINIFDLTFEQLNPFVLRLPTEYEAVMDRYSDYFSTPADIAQVSNFQIVSFASTQPVYACPQTTCDELTTIQPDRSLFMLGIVSCDQESTDNETFFCQSPQQNDWLEVTLDYRIGYVPLPTD